MAAAANEAEKMARFAQQVEEAITDTATALEKETGGEEGEAPPLEQIFGAAGAKMMRAECSERNIPLTAALPIVLVCAVRAAQYAPRATAASARPSHSFCAAEAPLCHFRSTPLRCAASPGLRTPPLSPTGGVHGF